MMWKTACFTGHRKLPHDRLEIIVSSLRSAIEEAFANGYRDFICGGALGFDTLAALQTLEFRKAHPDVKLIMAIPCQNQAQKWSAKDREVYQSILQQADRCEILSQVYFSGCMQVRNRYMVDHSSLCICYMSSFHGGTASTVRYAAFRNIEIINLAMNYPQPDTMLREMQCCSMYTYRSAGQNAAIAHLSPLQARKLIYKNTSVSF